MAPGNRSNELPRPLAEADLSRVRALFTDVDGTLTTGDQLEAATLRALEQLHAAGVRIVLVSGRPAGWGECWMRELPVDAVVVENGGLWFVREGGRVRKLFAQPEAERLEARRRLASEVERALRLVPGARLSSDSAYTEVDLAIDHHEDVDLPPEAATKLEEALRARGVNAVRSSVHVNCWIGAFDKLSSARRVAKEALGLTLGPGDRQSVYVGDSFNDAPMFDGFALSVGVANVREVLDRISHPPKFVSRAREGAGFREVARAMLKAR